MAVLDELATFANDQAARQRIRPLVLRLGIWIGLDFEAGKFGKREVRRLRRGVIAFGQDEPDSGMEPSRTRSNVGATRFEQLAKIPGDTLLEIFGGAESGAREEDLPAPEDPLLALIVNAWPRLTAEQRLRVVEIIAPAVAPMPHAPPSSLRQVTEARNARGKRTSVAADKRAGA